MTKALSKSDRTTRLKVCAAQLIAHRTALRPARHHFQQRIMELAHQQCGSRRAAAELLKISDPHFSYENRMVRNAPLSEAQQQLCREMAELLFVDVTHAPRPWRATRDRFLRLMFDAAIGAAGVNRALPGRTRRAVGAVNRRAASELLGIHPNSFQRMYEQESQSA